MTPNYKRHVLELTVQKVEKVECWACLGLPFS